MVCILFTYHFVIARPSDDYRRLEPLTCLYIPDMKIDSIRNGEGEDTSFVGRLVC